jgi:hypothetical protein
MTIMIIYLFGMLLTGILLYVIVPDKHRPLSKLNWFGLGILSMLWFAFWPSIAAVWVWYWGEKLIQRIRGV